ncbi:hypothetical protein RKE25_19820 [Dyella sp. BiH032]|uniref:hypothetical protein n=1 Tax=Dyella sp. BiH032 TaxID=3075430 RepID=UPI002892CF94|nr:hypothetical protein [Dyella sp. BiH032]WNL45635.1 hypothetical protein RKE25_19820 [Dyella sp. BiH032]
MLNWIARQLRGNSQPQSQSSDTLRFRDADSAFATECKYTDNRVAERVALVAIIRTLKVKEGEEPVILVQVADADGPFAAFAIDPAGKLPDLREGDLVAWLAFSYSDTLSLVLGDKRSGWMGVLTAKLSLTYDSHRGFIPESVA